MSIKKVPSKLIQDLISGKTTRDDSTKPKIVQFLNISDYSNNIDSKVPLDEPLFNPEPPIVTFNNFQALHV